MVQRVVVGARLRRLPAVLKKQVLDPDAYGPLEGYHGLWQVEESFRITKHDLRVRPVWHWTPERIRAHIAIFFMAFACVRHLAYRVAIQKHRMSPEVIRSALVHRQCSILRCRHSGNRYVVPSKLTPAAEQIYATMGLSLTTTPYQLS